MTAEYSVEPLGIGRADAAETVLRSVPEWFGIESATQMYIKAADTMPTIVVTCREMPVGFLTIKSHFPETAEIYCIAVHRDHHGCGIGRRLVEAAERHLAGEDVRFFQVKTLAPEREDPNYARTRGFYLAMGFLPVEVFPELWDPENPCLLMIKALDNLATTDEQTYDLRDSE